MSILSDRCLASSSTALHLAGAGGGNDARPPGTGRRTGIPVPVQVLGTNDAVYQMPSATSTLRTGLAPLPAVPPNLIAITPRADIDAASSPARIEQMAPLPQLVTDPSYPPWAPPQLPSPPFMKGSKAQAVPQTQSQPVMPRQLLPPPHGFQSISSSASAAVSSADATLRCSSCGCDLPRGMPKPPAGTCTEVGVQANFPEETKEVLAADQTQLGRSHVSVQADSGQSTEERELSEIRADAAKQTREFSILVASMQQACKAAQARLVIARSEVAAQSIAAEAEVATLRQELVKITAFHEESTCEMKGCLDYAVCGALPSQAKFAAVEPGFASSKIAWDEHRDREELEQSLVGASEHMYDAPCWSSGALPFPPSSFVASAPEGSHNAKELSVRGQRLQARLARDRGLVRLEAALARNVARELHALHRGFVLEKVHERSCRKEKRLVVVSAEEMLLRWSKDLAGLGRSHSHLDLYEVIRIHYGIMARAYVLYPDLPSWRCFSLYTTARSYDFCCADDATVEACVLALSRLCDWAAGAVVGGRGHFVALKGWCKLQESCFKRRVPLCRLFRDAALRAASKIAAAEHRPSPPEILPSASSHDLLPSADTVTDAALERLSTKLPGAVVVSPPPIASAGSTAPALVHGNSVTDKEVCRCCHQTLSKATSAALTKQQRLKVRDDTGL